MIKKTIILFFLIFMAFSCNKSDTGKVSIERQEPHSFQPPPVIQGLKFNKNYNGYNIYVEASLQDTKEPDFHIFSFLEAEFIFRLKDISLKLSDKKTHIEVSGNIAYTNKDYTAFKIYNLKRLSINGKTFSEEELRGKKLVVFFENEKLIYSLEQR